MKFARTAGSSRKCSWLRGAAAALVLAAILAGARLALANIFPQYLPNGRTYDQERNYIQWNGSVAYVTLFHRDNTSLPPGEGGASCVGGCTEQVTRIQSGSSVSGNFTYLQTFSVQAAYSGDSSVGTVTVRACGQVIFSDYLYQANQSAPGFANLPNPAWNVPTAGDCTWSISASGGYVDVRAVTTTYRTTLAPTVDLRVNGSNGPLLLNAPANYTLSWTSTNAASCTASASWSGAQATSGSQNVNGASGGAYTYTLTCSNPSGSAQDSVSVNVLSAPTVSVSAPAFVTAPGGYTASWTSANAVACSGSERFTGLSGLTGARVEVGLPVGSYDYSVTCTNAAGVSVSDTKRTLVVAAPTVDLKVDGSDGPLLFRSAPASYAAAWTSTQAVSCSGSARLAGASGLSGTRPEAGVPAGSTYDYSVTCQNPAGATASDTVRMIVVAAPTVDVRVNGSNGPLTFQEPAAFTVSWTSANSVSCSALNDLSGPVGTSGSQALSSVAQGAYQYTVQCMNLAGTTAFDTVVVNVNPPPPVVDLQVEGGDGPLTQVEPGSYTLTWTSRYAASCAAGSSDGLWAGTVNPSGSALIAGALLGTHAYTLTCSNVSGTTSDSVTVIVVAPLSGTVSPTFARLVLYGPNLGLPAQTLTGTAAGGEPPYAVAVSVRAPSGAVRTFSRSGSAWSLSPSAAGDDDFGTTEQGTWTVWADLTDSAGRTFRTTSSAWVVSWYPVHGRP